MRLSFSSGFSLLEILEVFLAIVCVVLAVTRPHFGAGLFSRIEDYLRRLAARPSWAISALALLPIVIRLLMLPAYGVPHPLIHDEFAYLLQADTFASGRLTNPSHPLWKHFESIYIISKPTYTGQYQVAQGLLLAAGQLLAHSPWAAVVVAMGVLCALLFWCLSAWVSAQWALVGGFIAVIEWGILSYWMNTYWGATIPAIGGTLVFGSLPRLRARLSLGQALLFGGGIVILMNSRPLDALFLFCIGGIALVTWFVTDKQQGFAAFASSVVLPVAVLLAIAASFMAYYNFRVTGNPAKLPYAVNREMYGTPQGFYFSKPYIVKNPMPRDVRMEYEDQLRRLERRSSPIELAKATLGKFRTFWLFFIGIPLTVPMIYLPLVWKGPNMSVVLASIVVTGLSNLLYHAFFPQYAAAILPVILLIVLLCLQKMRGTGVRGLALSRMLPLVCVFAVAVPVFGRIIEPLFPNRLYKLRRLWESEFWPDSARYQFESFLDGQPGKQLVIVHYEFPAHDVHDEWVYNKADIDHSKIVWARDLGQDADRKLLDYFKDRKAWIAEPDQRPPTMLPLTVR